MEATALVQTMKGGMQRKPMVSCSLPVKFIVTFNRVQCLRTVYFVLKFSS